jgi:hypothetical protein
LTVSSFAGLLVLQAIADNCPAALINPKEPRIAKTPGRRQGAESDENRWPVNLSLFPVEAFDTSFAKQRGWRLRFYKEGFCGTGRFASATGTFNLGGQIDLNTGAFSLPWEGTISTAGSSR